MQEDNIDKIDEAINAGAKVIARWLKAPGGGGSFDDAVIEHRVWFQGAHARGMKCPAIVDVLYNAGIKRENGLPLSQGHVRGVLSRRLHKKIPSRRVSLQALLNQYGPKPAAKRQGSIGRAKLSAGKSNALGPAPGTLQTRRPRERAGPSTEKQGARPGGPEDKMNTATNTISDPNGIRSRMKRADALRRRAEED
jgi:hypothetical protein